MLALGFAGGDRLGENVIWPLRGLIVCVGPSPQSPKVVRAAKRLAMRLHAELIAVYVETPKEEPGRIDPHDYVLLQENIRFAKELGAKVIKLKGRRVADALIDFACQEGITHVVFGQSARSRWDIFLHGSVINRFLRDVRSASVHVVPLERKNTEGDVR